MAEGLLRLLAPDRFVSLSAGARPAGFVHPLAKRVIEEAGGNLDDCHSKPLSDFERPDAAPDLIVSLCDVAWKRLRKSPIDVPRVLWSIPDPIHARGNEDEQLTAFRWVRDRICIRIEDALDDGTFERSIDPRTTSSRSGGGRLGRLHRLVARLRDFVARS
jgi:arsenate reductase